MIIDMETYPGYLKQQSEKDGSSVQEKINKSTEIKLANWVIHPGMLPVLTWGRGNRGVLISAMGTEEKIKTPFKLPVVKDDKTSDIHIEYEPVDNWHIKECIVRTKNDQVINVDRFYGMHYQRILQSVHGGNRQNKKVEGDVVMVF